MKRIAITLTTLVLCLGQASAQVKDLYAEARGSHLSNIYQKDYKSSFQGEYLNLVLSGNFTPKLSYYWRQRFTKPLYSPNVPLNATDQLWLRWNISDKWAIQGGKLAVVIGGYEYDDAPIDLYYWGDFASNLPEVYAIGGNLIFSPKVNQTLMFQFTQSPLGVNSPNCYHGALIWDGRFTRWWHTIWSVNMMKNPASGYLGILALGNRFDIGPVGIEMDFAYRTDTRKLCADYNTVLKVVYDIPGWSFFVKGGNDYNWDCSTDVVKERKHTKFIGGGVEFFPLKNNDIRIHAVSWWNTDINFVNLSLGITYRLRVVKKDSSTNS